VLTGSKSSLQQRLLAAWPTILLSRFYATKSRVMIIEKEPYFSFGYQLQFPLSHFKIAYYHRRILLDASFMKTNLVLQCTTSYNAGFLHSIRRYLSFEQCFLTLILKCHGKYGLQTLLFSPNQKIKTSCIGSVPNFITISRVGANTNFILN